MLSEYTVGEDTREVILRLSHLVDPDNPMLVLANQGKALPGAYINLDDLESISGLYGICISITPPSTTGSNFVLYSIRDR
jgi:hypothetical protein